MRPVPTVFLRLAFSDQLSVPSCQPFVPWIPPRRDRLVSGGQRTLPGLSSGVSAAGADVSLVVHGPATASAADAVCLGVAVMASLAILVPSRSGVSSLSVVMSKGVVDIPLAEGAGSLGYIMLANHKTSEHSCLQNRSPRGTLHGLTFDVKHDAKSAQHSTAGSRGVCQDGCFDSIDSV